MKETDLYPPVKRYLEGPGYTVKGEVDDCDVVAVRRGEEPVVVELKLTLNRCVASRREVAENRRGRGR